MILLFSFVSMALYAQEKVNLGKMEEKQKNEYLVKLAKDVTKVISTESYNNCDFDREAYIEKRKNDEGRIFYTISFYPVGIGDKTHFSYYKMGKDGKLVEQKRRYTAASVDVWENTGLPKLFMSGDNNGIFFNEEGKYSFYELKKRYSDNK